MTQFMEAAVVSCPCTVTTVNFSHWFRRRTFASTNPKHEGVHFFLDVPVAHLVAVLVRGLQQHVQEGLSLLSAVVGVAVGLHAGDVLRSFGYHLNGGGRSREESGSSASKRTPQLLTLWVKE